jgi:hypothetical protein
MATPDWVPRVQQAEQLLNQGRLDEAAVLAEQVLRQEPDCAVAHQVVGMALAEASCPREAIPRLTRALALQPGLVPAHTALGRCCTLLGDLDLALYHFEKAIFLQPTHAMAHFNRGTAFLKQGRYREGWLEYEWRAYCGLVQWPTIPLPRWDGCPLQGRSILIHTEQGLGDVLQFLRFLPELARRGARIIFACQKPLQPFLRTLSCVDEWFPIDEPGTITFEMYSSLLSLPALLGVEEATIPREVPYVAADPQRVEKWRARIRGLPGLKVGICWHGSPTFKGNHLRSVPLAQFAPLATVPGVTLVSLQKGAGTEQIGPNRGSVPLVVLDDLDRDATFVDTAAVMQHLDLVITSDTSVPHLAGALGRPVWVLVATGCDWRWLVGRSDSPWYPTMRLFRQKEFGEWAGVFAEVAAALRHEAAGRARGS